LQRTQANLLLSENPGRHAVQVEADKQEEHPAEQGMNLSPEIKKPN
jgi:hypothetical protein